MKTHLRVFKAMADETRLRIIEFLLGGERCVCEIVPYTGRTQSTVSIQLGKLEDLGIVESRRRGKSVYYRMADERIKWVLSILKDPSSLCIYRPIGVVHSRFREAEGTPIQAASAEEAEGTVEVFPEYSRGLKDLEGFSHIILVYHFHRSRKTSLEVTPYMDENTHGVFATRAPCRPNPVGISTVRLIKIRKNMLHISGVDILDGTPLLDIKPYVPEFDVREVQKTGWLGDKIQRLSEARDDGRFTG